MSNASRQIPIEKSVHLDDSSLSEADFNLPAISVTFFCESESLLNAANQCCTDRRLRRSSVSVYNGSVTEAVSVYQDTVTPNVLIVECRKNVSGVLSDLAGLAEICDANTRVVIVGSMNDIDLYRELIKQGVSEYLVTPITATKIINTLGNLFNDPESVPKARSLAFIGSSGGCGSSSIAQNIAVCLSREFHASVILADYNFSFGTVGLNFNAEDKRSLFEMSETDSVDENVLAGLLTPINDKLRLAISPADPGSESAMTPELCDKISGFAKNLADYVIYDLPSGAMTNSVFQTLIMADEIFITVTPNVIGVRNAAKLYSKLQELRLNDPPPHLILNQKGAPEKSEIDLKTVAATVGKYPNFIINYDGELFERSLSEGIDLETADANSQAVAVVRQCAAFVTGKTTVQKASGGLKKILGNLFKS